ncbi:hypothetical protein GCM10009856_53530 [Mycolicibacterium llatzerense]
MHAAWHTDYFEPNNPSMNSAIVKEGSAANGDGHDSYAARRRKLACRPLALGRHHGAHESLPLTATNQPAGTRRPPPTNTDALFIASKAERPARPINNAHTHP